ncbi:MAG: hypothetical protein D4R93_03350 [Deltaproteobacteria bacterium]|nr:MAG: hypothetical protein D4R93_03350 [Deltaproteobacteria bacterium]
MNLKTVHIKNYRSCKDVRIELQPQLMHALVGANNAGKSNILRALDLLFNPSVTKVDEECFWNKDTSLTIWVEALFNNLTPEETEKLKGYLRPDGTFHIARSVRIAVSQPDEQGASSDEDEDKRLISQHYCRPMPKQAWLRESEINGENIARWWKEKDTLRVNGASFADFVGGAKPAVGVWKEKANEFVRQHLTEKDFEDNWADNPKGYSGVLKGTLPHFIYIPAVRDLSDEAKVTKSNPFGRLLYAVLSGVTDEQKGSLNQSLVSLQNKLNRAGGDERLASIVQTEKRLNEFLQEYMLGELEIEFEPPTLETLLTTPRLYADDGFRNVVENKGHGLQRAIIFSILRCYAELVAGKGNDKKKSTIFTIEEPELYMHPLAQRTIRRVFQDISDAKDQVIFATHSSLLLDVAFFDEIIRVEAIQHTDGQNKTVESKVWQLSMDKMIADIEARYPKLKGKITAQSMRDRYAHAYHPTRSEGFFAKSVILVEGPTEQYSLPIYAEAVRYPLDSLNISVVDCGGKGPMDRLYRVFNELGIPCYVVFDYDSQNTDTDGIDKSKELLSLLNENPAAPTKILIKDTVACFPNKWEVDLAPEIPDIQTHTAAARKELGLTNDSGKPLVARYIARSLTLQKPPVVPPSIKGIIEKAVRVKWEKSCLSTPPPTT